MNEPTFTFLKLFDDRDGQEYSIKDFCITVSEQNKIGIMYKKNSQYDFFEENELTSFLFTTVFNYFKFYEAENASIFQYSFMGFRFNINKCIFHGKQAYVVLCEKKPDNLYDMIDSYISSVQKDELLNNMVDKFDKKHEQRL